MATIQAQRVRRWLGIAAAALALTAGVAAAAAVGRTLVGAIEAARGAEAASAGEYPR